MKLLLDTHLAVWSISLIRRVPTHILEMIREPSNDVFVSTVSLWEIAIKNRQGRRDPMPYPVGDTLAHFREASYEIVDLGPDVVRVFETLPVIHADPFDRMLVAQALHGSMSLVTHDRALVRYSDTIIAF